jgi:hypothetical protein
MRPKSPAEDRDEDLFRSRLANMLDPRHELLRLAALIDWAALDCSATIWMVAGVNQDDAEAARWWDDGQG